MKQVVLMPIDAKAAKKLLKSWDKKKTAKATIAEAIANGDEVPREEAFASVNRLSFDKDGTLARGGEVLKAVVAAKREVELYAEFDDVLNVLKAQKGIASLWAGKISKDVSDVMLGKKVGVFDAEIDPLTASFLLMSNWRNREISDKNVKELAKAINDGAWEIQPDEICVSPGRDLLTNGQTRLLACVVADKPIVATFRSGVAQNVGMDLARKRTVGTTYQIIYSSVDKPIRPSIANLAYRLVTGKHESPDMATSMKIYHALSPYVMDNVNLFKRASTTTFKANDSLFCAMLVMLLNGVDPDDLNQIEGMLFANTPMRDPKVDKKMRVVQNRISTQSEEFKDIKSSAGSQITKTYAFLSDFVPILEGKKADPILVDDKSCGNPKKEKAYAKRYAEIRAYVEKALKDKVETAMKEDLPIYGGAD